MHIIIPMSGIGRRFLEAGYKVPKPLIEIDGMPIIEHVVNLFPGESKFTFICNAEHLAHTQMRAVLKRIAPSGTIRAVEPHKLGPVYAVSQIFDMLDDQEECIVNYCDFGTYWDYKDFLNHTRSRKADGAIPSYKGFHPHMLGTTNYAFMRDDKQWMLEIREKQPFTANRMNEYASNGTYYFKKGNYIKKYFTELMVHEISVNGEFYVSMVYNLLTADELTVSIYEIEHMLQWGTPEDVLEYNRWSSYFKSILNFKPEIKLEKGSINLIPLAGRGKRFADEGFDDPKPLIPVSGKPMIIQASEYLPGADERVFVCLEEHLEKFPLGEELKKQYPNARIVSLSQVTEGQACTCEIGLEGANPESPLLISACDNGMLYDSDKYALLVNDPSIDAIYWSFRHHPSAVKNPQMYGWIKIDELDDVTGISVKKSITQDPFNDHAVVGTFYFKKARYFIEALDAMYKKNIRVNNEFYVDSCANELIDSGRKVKIFEVENYIGWGTPDDYRTFNYWQSFFHKCQWHSYRLDGDRTVAPQAAEDLNILFQTFTQEYQ